MPSINNKDLHNGGERTLFKLSDILNKPEEFEDIVSKEKLTEQEIISELLETDELVSEIPTDELTEAPTEAPTEALTEVVIEDTPSPTMAKVEETASSPTTTPIAEIIESPTQVLVASSTNTPTGNVEPNDEIPAESTMAPSDPPAEDPVTEPPASLGTSDPTTGGTTGGTTGSTLAGSVGATMTASDAGVSFGISSTFTGSETGAPDYNFTYSEPEVNLNVLVLGGEPIQMSLKNIGKDYREFTSGKVNIFIDNFSSDDLPKIRTDSKLDVSVYDLYVVNPVQAAASDVLDNFKKLDDVIDDVGFLSDVFLGYGEISQFKGETIMVPLEGDVLSLYYRSDILDHFELSVPKTWGQYTEVAEAIHGESYNGTTLVGSCVTRRKGCSGYLWTNLLLSSMTQYEGTKSGFLYDPNNMKPLTGEALESVIKDLEGQVLNGAADEFMRCDTVDSATAIEWMNEGSCAMTYNWGSVFKSQTGSAAVISTAPTPGSLYVLDRDTNKLARCNEETCGKNGYYDSELGWINVAPYAAGGGWSGAIPKNVEPNKLDEIVDFLMFASDNPRKASDASKIINDPYRESQLNENAYEGIPSEEVEQYLQTVQNSLESENLVVDIRFSEAREIVQIYESEITAHLEDVRARGAYASTAERVRVVESIDNGLNDIIGFHDSYSDVNAITKYQQSLNLMSDDGRLSSFGSFGSSSAFRNNRSFVGIDSTLMSISFCILCVFFISFR